MTEPRPPVGPTVFGAPDQAEIIARIDSVEDDDLSSSFFQNSMQDVEDAAVRMFDIGIRTLTDDPGDAPRASFGTAAPVLHAAEVREPSRPQPGQGAADRFVDPSVRAAFILGGPAAIAA